MPEQKRDYYEVLGVSKDASDDDLKRAYRKMAKEYHPDLHPGDKNAEEKFKEANEAYEVLSDKQKRQMYDTYGHAGVDPNFAASQGGGFGGGFGGFGDLGSIFESFFGGGFGSERTTGPAKGESIRATITLDLNEAAFGCKKKIDITRIEDCDTCKGSGAASGSSPETCSNCHGTGQVRSTRRTPLGMVTTTDVCPVCHGRGKIVKNPCPDCGGEGRVSRSRTIEITIPAGIDEGQAIQLRGQGSAGRSGGRPGDLIVGIRIRQHDLFVRDGSSIHYDMDVSITQAALGAEVEVPTIDGNVKYTIPEGTQTGSTFRLKGKGVPFMNSNGRGDQYVHVNVVTPTGLSAKQKELLREFASLSGEEITSKKKKFWEK